MPALPFEALAPQPCGHHSRCCEALFRKASRPTSARCRLDRASWPCSAVEVAWFARPISSRLLRIARLRLLTPAAVAASADRVPRGQRAALDQFRTLLIDRSAKSVESSLPVLSGPGVAPASTSRQLTLLTHLETHLEALFVDTHCGLMSIFPSRLTAVALFFVDSSRLVQYPLPLCASVSSHCTAGLLLNLMPKLVLLGLVEFAAPPGFWCAFSGRCRKQDLKSRSASFGVLLTLPLVSHSRVQASCVLDEVISVCLAASSLNAGIAFHLDWRTCIAMIFDHDSRRQSLGRRESLTFSSCSLSPLLTHDVCCHGFCAASGLERVCFRASLFSACFAE